MVQDHIEARLWADHGPAFTQDAGALAAQGADALAAALRRVRGGLLALSLSALMLGLAAAPALSV